MFLIAAVDEVQLHLRRRVERGVDALDRFVSPGSGGHVGEDEYLLAPLFLLGDELDGVNHRRGDGPSGGDGAHVPQPRGGGGEIGREAAGGAAEIADGDGRVFRKLGHQRGGGSGGVFQA